MPLISVKLDPESDALMQALATKEHRSKREQMAVSALTHARSILPTFKAASVRRKKGGPRK